MEHKSNNNHLDIAETFEDAGVRPIVDNHLDIAETFEDAGVRPVVDNHLDIAETFEDAGVRPIEQSPEYLLPKKRIEKDVAVEIIDESCS